MPNPNTLQNNIGNIEKATIEIIDARGRDPERQPATKVVGGQGGGFGALAIADSALAAGGGTGLLSTMGIGGLDAVAMGQGLMAGATKKTYTVQFNPSSLQLRGRGPGFMPIYGFAPSADNRGTETVSPTNQEVRITFSVQLVFDQVHPFDAFMADKFNTAPSAVGVNIAKAVMTGKGKKTPTVQQTVEGFIAAIRSQYTRIITFSWGKMIYAGTLNTVNAQYTMFNMQGQPIHATMDLTILCVQDDIAANTMGVWMNAYKKAFSGQSFDAVRGVQTASNLLNLG